MNREIKFRGKRVDISEWIYGVPVKYCRKTYILEMTDFEEERVYSDIPTKEMWSHEVNSHTIGQYTGLKDKNGVEIYEGDIAIERNKEIGDMYFEVVFFEGAFMAKEIGFDPEYLLEDFIRDIEVIGNIYENPELLEGV